MMPNDELAERVAALDADIVDLRAQLAKVPDEVLLRMAEALERAMLDNRQLPTTSL
jgi:uncharacterized small protein (DUF1192 family)